MLIHIYYNTFSYMSLERVKDNQRNHCFILISPNIRATLRSLETIHSKQYNWEQQNIAPQKDWEENKGSQKALSKVKRKTPAVTQRPVRWNDRWAHKADVCEWDRITNKFHWQGPGLDPLTIWMVKVATRWDRS